jgi:hypothetical protein
MEGHFVKKLLLLLAFCFLGSNLFAQFEDLHRAALQGRTSIVEELVSSGLNVNGADSYGRTALMFAAFNGQIETVTKLIELGADVNARGKGAFEWQTPLVSAAMKGHTEVVVKLIEKGADVGAKDKYGETALDRAKSGGYTETVTELRKATEAKTKGTAKTKGLRGFIDFVRSALIGQTTTEGKPKEVETTQPELSNQEILNADARAYLSAYIGEADATDEEIALETILKFYDGFLSKSGGEEYKAVLVAMAKEGNIDFLAGVKLDKFSAVSDHYKKVVALYKGFYDALISPTKGSVDNETAKGELLKKLEVDRAIEEMRTELRRLKPLK